MYIQCTCFIFCSNICDLVYMPPAITCRILVKKIKYDYKQESKYDELSWPLQHENTDLALLKLLNCSANAINQLYLCNILTPFNFFLNLLTKYVLYYINSHCILFSSGLSFSHSLKALFLGELSYQKCCPKLLPLHGSSGRKWNFNWKGEYRFS